jgi:hypothetical protein
MSSVNECGIPHQLDPRGVLPQWFLRRNSTAWLRYMLGDPCVYCGREADSTEHVMPASKGGPNHWGNLARACRDCNSSRSSHPFIVWMLDRCIGEKRRTVVRLMDDPMRALARRQWGYPKRAPGTNWAVKLRHAGRRY